MDKYKDILLVYAILCMNNPIHEYILNKKNHKYLVKNNYSMDINQNDIGRPAPVPILLF